MSTTILHGRVVRGLGRGSAALGCPTANLGHLSMASEQLLVSLEDGVYACWACLGMTSPGIIPAVASVGTNPHYGDLGAGVRVVEVHLMREFDAPFYDAELIVAMVLPRMRGMESFASEAALKLAIHNDMIEATHVLDESPVSYRARADLIQYQKQTLDPAT